MIRSLVVALLILAAGVVSSNLLIGYSRAGKEYISKHREARKSIRYGSGFYAGGPRGFRGGGK